MKLNIANAPYIDRSTGEFVEGRMKVFLHNTNIYADVFTMEGSSFVAAENPQLLHSGLPEDTLFTEIGIYDIVIEKYIGEEGHMTVDSPDSDFSMIDEFETGIDFDLNAFNANRVDTMDDLRNADPSLGYVTVNWYAEPGDCIPRTYIWDAASVNAEDGGYVVSSDVSATGRWILFWDDEVLPACVYGVKPGEESNMNLLLSYPSVVGSFLMATAPCIRFQSGDYTSDAYYSTSKELCFDAGARFTAATVVCPSIRLFGANTSYISDFVFTSDNVEAHSSWFRTVTAFWTCDAHKYVLDQTNYFANTVLNATPDLYRKVIEGSHRLEMTYASGRYLTIRYSSILGQHLFSPRYDKIKFAGMVFDQSWFVETGINYWDFGEIASHNIELLTRYTNVIDFNRFTSPNVYLKACLANGDTTFDGHGETYSDYHDNTQFDSISNATFTYSYGFTDNTCDTWTNVKVPNGIVFNGGNRSLWMTNCDFKIVSGTTTNAITFARLTDCNVGNGGVWSPSYTATSVYGGTWSASVQLTDAAKSARTVNKTLAFKDCTISYSGSWVVNHISLNGCTTNVNLKLVPYNDNGTLRNYGEFIGNLFTQGALITINAENPSTESDVHHVVATLTFKDNRFNQEDSRGIVIPHLTNAFDRNKPYLDIHSTGLYMGNTGNCPQEHPTPVFLSREMTGTLSFSTWSLKYMPKVWAKRVWNLNPSPYFNHGYGWMCAPDFSESWNVFTGRNASMYEITLLHMGYLTEGADENDQFSVVHCWRDYDAFSDNRFVVCPVLDYGH